jgi:deazaflavin-dependent oxidoreductase (nitroreductase family)
VFNPLVVRLRLSPTLIVRGRRSGKQRSVPFDGPFEYEGRRYLVSPMGDSYWARNLRAAGEAELRIRRQREQIRVVEMQDPERSAIVKAYAASLTCNCRTYMARLPNPADHPVFRIDPPDEVVDHGAQLGP